MNDITEFLIHSNRIEDLIKAGVFGIKGFLTHSGIDEFPNVSKEDLERIGSGKIYGE